MGIPAGMLSHRVTVWRRALVANDVLSGRGDFVAVEGLTHNAAAFRTEAMRAAQLGNQPVPGVDGEVTLRLSALAQTITVADLMEIDGARFAIVSIDLPDRHHGVIRFKVKRATR